MQIDRVKSLAVAAATTQQQLLLKNAQHVSNFIAYNSFKLEEEKLNTESEQLKLFVN